jgi:hypothetical protein
MTIFQVEQLQEEVNGIVLSRQAIFEIGTNTYKQTAGNSWSYSRSSIEMLNGSSQRNRQAKEILEILRSAGKTPDISHGAR